MKKFLCIILGIFLISLASASSLTISPSKIILNNTFSGETHYQNISVITDGKYALTLSILEDLNNSISLENTDYIVNGTQNISVGFKINSSAEAKTYSFTLQGKIEVATIESSSSSSSSGGGSGGGVSVVYRDRNITIYSNETDTTKLNELQKTIDDLLKKVGYDTDKINNLERKNKLIGIHFGVMTFIAIIFFIMFVKAKSPSSIWNKHSS